VIVCPACGRENPDDGRFCGACATPLAAPAAPREERKVVTVVFADLVGSTARADGADPEDVRAVLAPYHSRLRHELEAHGGTVEKFIGDAVVAVFGAPAAHEDDPERAVRAALAIQEAIDELNEAEPALELEVRIGVNTGEALVALEARPESGEGMVSGDVINTAARLQAAAPPGAVLVGELTFRGTERMIRYDDHTAVAAKGKAAPVPAWLAVEPRSSFGIEDVSVGRVPLVGREREVALLADALARVRRDERSQLITLAGVPGIGKSRLVQELRDLVEADPELIVWRRGRSLPYGEGIPYWSLGEIVKAQAGVLESDGADAASEKLTTAIDAIVSDRGEAAWLERLLRPLLGLPVPQAQSSRAESFSAWRRLLEALASERPTVLVFEDVHWADDDLLDFVDTLVDEVDAVPLLVVCTARPELLARRPGWGGGKLNALTLSLAPLSDEETARLLASLLERSVLPAEAQAVLLERAEGVPLFAEEYARMLEAGTPSGDLPETLHGLVAARVDGLPAAEKALLQDAAVLGKVFWADALGVLAGEDDLEPRLRVLERQEFVRRERRSAVEGARQYAFLHAIVREVAYGQIPRAARAAKHRKAAEWIASLSTERAEDRAEVLAYHLDSAVSYGEAAGTEVGDLRPLLSRALREAGERADALNLKIRAASYFRRALDADPAHRDPELVFLHAQAKMWGEGVEGDPTEPLRAAVDELLAAGRTDLAAEALPLLERALWNIGQPRPELLDEALELVADMGPTPTRGRTISAVAVRWALSGRAADGLPLAREAVEIARAHGDRDEEVRSLNNMSVALGGCGDLAGALESARGCLALALECGATDMPRPYINLATYEYDVGNLREALRLHREALELAERLDHRAGGDWLRAELVLDLFELGDWDEALHGVHELAGGRRERGVTYYLDSQLWVVGAVIEAAREGRLPEGRLDELVREAYGMGDTQAVVPVLSHASGLALWLDRPHDAARYLDDYRERLLADEGWEGGGTVYVTAALAWLGCRGEPLPANLLRGPMTPWREAAELIGNGRSVEAADVLHGTGALSVEADVRLHAARSLAETDPVQAERQLDLACDFWRSVRATARLGRADDVRAGLRQAAS
jgi:class 3 adenylate cyclase/tetratricopeptide (TPR) repeat protein